jgi:hypothetical protein
VTGQFQVLQITASPIDAGEPDDPGGKLQAFTATFEQHCEGGTASNVGCVHVTR